ncbi:MAG: hypothetical protein JWQ34_2435 [Mucilaginibacter sp.]|uniref:hypothetical protein n=1 Tax=Mucilaginibacter sp. TaxID=1882438 RepID=UPI00260E6B78|nr:hypothetical protein [Mucilaginibacter sp.]MDB5004210.1 hypothetical protein [Mucilaginibacter sp.]
MKKILPICIAGILLVSACDDNNNNNDDQAKTVDKNGSVEVTLSSRHLDSLKDELTTHYKVWRKGSIINEFNKKDTVAGLESFKTEGENDNGDTQNIKVKKDYEFFVTVK